MGIFQGATYISNRHPRPYKMLHYVVRHHSRLFGTAKVIELVQSNIANIKGATTRLADG